MFKASFTFDIFWINKDEITGLTASDSSSGDNFFSERLDKASKIFFRSLIGTLSTKRFLKINVRWCKGTSFGTTDWTSWGLTFDKLSNNDWTSSWLNNSPAYFNKTWFKWVPITASGSTTI